jgi:hypothetical protein
MNPFAGAVFELSIAAYLIRFGLKQDKSSVIV